MGEKIDCLSCCCFFGLFFFTIPIYLGCFFGIYYRSFTEYQQSTCRLHSYFEEFYSSEKKDGDPITLYRQLRLYISINTKTYVGMACFSDGNELSTLEMDSSYNYAYEYARCDNWKNSTNYSCKSYQEVQSRWMCDGINTPIPTENQEFDCWYALVNNAGRDIDRVSVFEQYPHQYKPYIEILFDEEPYYPVDEYYALQIVNLGFLVILPFVYLIFVGIPAMYKFKIYRYCFSKIHRCLVKRICVCWKCYDPFLLVEDRKVLFMHAAVCSTKNRFSHKLAKRVLPYFAENN